ncbi:hypothetical protein ACIQUB_08330 [Rhizobium sp. NPDC090275]|uniref:hypothetical protein n=1 Tax=Rhizobium sp. NPDC090275 TaxID=3364498 RepID=UPI00383AB299
MANELRDKMRVFLSATKKAGKDLGDGIEALREQIVRLREQRGRLLSVPVNKTVALERAERWARSKVEISTIVDGSMFVGASPNWRGPEMTLEAAFGAFAGEFLINGVRRAVEHQYAAGLEGISEDDRVVKLMEIDRKLLDAELSEESIIRTAEAAGFPATRRADADPRAVLAHDEVLP